MPETITDADRIAAEGVPIPTTRGDLRLIYGMRALRQLEDTYGGLGQLQDAMQTLMENLEATGKGKAFGPLLDIVCPGLLHHGLTMEQAEDVLMPRHVKLYTEAMAEAMRQAFPDDDTTPAGQGNDDAQAPASASPGPTGTTSQPAATDATPPSSGA